MTTIALPWYPEALAIHEAGHTAVAMGLGIGVESVEIARDGGAAWFDTREAGDDLLGVALYLGGPLSVALATGDELDLDDLRWALRREVQNAEGDLDWKRVSDGELERVAAIVRGVLSDEWERLATVAALLEKHGTIEF